MSTDAGNTPATGVVGEADNTLRSNEGNADLDEGEGYTNAAVSYQNEEGVVVAKDEEQEKNSKLETNKALAHQGSMKDTSQGTVDNGSQVGKYEKEKDGAVSSRIRGGGIFERAASTPNPFTATSQGGEFGMASLHFFSSAHLPCTPKD